MFRVHRFARGAVGSCFFRPWRRRRVPSRVPFATRPAPCCRASRSRRPARCSSKRCARSSPTRTGQYRIVDLRPGTYTVTFTLTGFSTVRQEGIELTGSFTATVNAEMRVGTVEETITVTGESPIVDVQTARSSASSTSEVLDAIPAGRSYLNVVVLVPGVTATQAARARCSTSAAPPTCRRRRFQIHGGRATDTRVMIDGVRIGNALATSSVTNFVPNQGGTSK